MLQTEKSAQFILVTMGIKNGDKLLVLTDTSAWHMRLGETLMHVASSM
ncbi:hypothetical protein ACFLWI_05855 [Chloroflexota bacterium]